MGRFAPYLHPFKMGVDYPEDHPLSMLCKEIVCKGLSPSKLAKSKIARMTELSKEVPENFREFQAKIRLDREVALKNAGLFDQDENDKNLTDEEKKKKEQEERELTIDECSFERLVEMGAIYSMDGDKLSDEDRDELKETVQLQQARKIVELVLIANGEIQPVPLENASDDSIPT